MPLSLSVENEGKCRKWHLSLVSDLSEILSPTWHFLNLLMDCVVQLNCHWTECGSWSMLYSEKQELSDSETMKFRTSIFSRTNNYVISDIITHVHCALHAGAVKGVSKVADCPGPHTYIRFTAENF
jgi:hypothetical protein